MAGSPTTSGAVSIGEAKTHLSKLVARAERGEEIVLRRGDKPVVKLVKIEEPATPKRSLRGLYAGEMWIADDFDEPLEDFAEYM